MNLAHSQSRARLSGILLVIFASACWGSSGIFIVNITERSPLSAVGLAFWRDLFSSLLLLAGILVFQPRLLILKIKDLPWLLGMGVISIGAFHIFWNQAVLNLGASLATVIQCTAPIFVAVMARVFFSEPLTPRKLLAIACAAGGTILVAGFANGKSWVFDFSGIRMALLSALTYGTLSLFGKKLSADYSPWTITFYIFLIGTVTILLFQGGKPEPWPAGSNVLVWILGFVLMSTILGFGLYTRALAVLPASIASITATSEILSASILASLFLGEQVGGWKIPGTLLVVLGVVLVSWKRKES